LQTIHHWSDDVILEDMTLPGLAELKGRWHGSLDASGGGNGDTLVFIEDLNSFFFSIVLPTYSSKRDPWAYGSDLNIQLAVEGLK
jgi:hypothetical protein